jgi:hypothetical protein
VVPFLIVIGASRPPSTRWMEQCYRAYEQHCIEMHGADAESCIHFDLQKLMLSLKK